mmetsp:Transcript_6129/g.17486  ORF Transcript_6129/g.17486 Transcript_6129/m.17486 type:complete len:361 (-) Transcript_6129:32-1114(-)
MVHLGIRHLVRRPELDAEVRQWAAGRHDGELLLGGVLGRRTLDPSVAARLGRGASVPGVQAQQLRDELLARLCDVAPAPLVVLDSGLELGGRVEGRVAAQHPEQDEADAEEIDPETVVLVVEHLRREPSGGAAHHVERDEAVRPRALREAEVAELQGQAPLRLREQEVLGLDVGMNQTADIVQVSKSGQHLAGAVLHLGLPESLPVLHQAPEVSVGHQRRHQHDRLGRLLRGEKSDAIRVRQHREMHSCLLEGAPPLELGTKLALHENLDDDLARLVRPIGRDENGAREVSGDDPPRERELLRDVAGLHRRPLQLKMRHVSCASNNCSARNRAPQSLEANGHTHTNPRRGEITNHFGRNG